MTKTQSGRESLIAYVTFGCEITLSSCPCKRDFSWLKFLTALMVADISNSTGSNCYSCCRDDSSVTASSSGGNRNDRNRVKSQTFCKGKGHLYLTSVVPSVLQARDCYQWKPTVRPLPPCLDCQCSVLRVFKAMATRIRGKTKRTLKSLKIKPGTSRSESGALTN